MGSSVMNVINHCRRSCLYSPINQCLHHPGCMRCHPKRQHGQQQNPAAKSSRPTHILLPSRTKIRTDTWQARSRTRSAFGLALGTQLCAWHAGQLTTALLLPPCLEDRQMNVPRPGMSGNFHLSCCLFVARDIIVCFCSRFEGGEWQWVSGTPLTFENWHNPNGKRPQR